MNREAASSVHCFARLPVCADRGFPHADPASCGPGIVGEPKKIGADGRQGAGWLVLQFRAGSVAVAIGSNSRRKSSGRDDISAGGGVVKLHDFGNIGSST